MKTTSRDNRIRRHARIRSRVSGTATRPRLSVFKSNKAVYAQLIDDEKEKTILAVNTAQLTDKEAKGKTPLVLAELVGTALAKAAIDLGVKAIVFDRGGFNYQGQVKALADGARKGGLTF